MMPAEPVVVLGPCDEHRAEVFVRLAVAAAGIRPRLSGTLTGPHCSRATTLPIAAEFADLGPPPGGDSAGRPMLVARTTLTEPSFWTPELPHRYRLDLRVTAGDEEVARCVRTIGLRRLGVRGRSLWFDGRRYVPRAVVCQRDDVATAALGGRAAAAVMSDPDAGLLAECDAAGVAVIAVGEDRAGATGWPAAEADLAAWSGHPAVVIGVGPREMSAADMAAVARAARRVKGTLLLGWRVAGAAAPPPEVPPGIDVLVVELDRGGLPHEGWRRAPDRPLVAWRNDGAPVGERRRGCDLLQAALAAWGMPESGGTQPRDWAGYVSG